MWNDKLIFYDLETTGVDADLCRIVQLAYVLYENGEEQGFGELVMNPCQSISQGASLVHGYTDAKVADLAPFSTHAQDLFGLFADRVWVGYNNKRFDDVILKREFQLAGYAIPKAVGVVDCYRQFIHKHGKSFKRGERTLHACHVKYCGTAFEDAHNAVADVKAVIKCLEAMIVKHPEMEDIQVAISVSGAEDLTIDRLGFFKFHGTTHQPIMAKGKHASLPMEKVPLSYYIWIASSDFPASTSNVAKNAIKGIFPKYKA